MRLIDDAYGLVVDAVLGPGVRLAEAGGPCARALATLKRLSIPLVSLDVPSGTPPRGSLVTLACFFHPSQILPSAPPHPHPRFSSSNSIDLSFRVWPHPVSHPPWVWEQYKWLPQVTRCPLGPGAQLHRHHPPPAQLLDRRELTRQRTRLPGQSC